MRMDTINIALLANSTVEYLEGMLREECAAHSLKVKTYCAPFGQYNQEAFDRKSGLYRLKPELVIIILDGRLLFPEWYDFTYQVSGMDREKAVEDVFQKIIAIALKIREHSNAKVIINNFRIPYHSPLGILDGKRGVGLKRMIGNLNARLEEFASNNDLIYIFDYGGLYSEAGRRSSDDRKMYYLAGMAMSRAFMKTLAKEYLRYILPLKGRSKKCLVLDLDNTLWGGIAGEDGLSGIKLDISGVGLCYREFQKAVLDLHGKGIVLAVNSKNNLRDALEIIEDHPHMLLRRECFSVLKINWSDKAQNLLEIAAELNIGLDSLVFFDDNPVEREYIRTALPTVTVVEVPEDPSRYVEALNDLVVFEYLNLTEEDLKRNKMYEENIRRRYAQKQFKTREEYLESLETCVTISPASSFTIPRIAQLTQKTNQFNMTGRRYQVEDIERLAASQAHRIFCCSVSDRFGESGLTGVCIAALEGRNARLDTFLLSCRVLGREVEYSFLSGIVRLLRASGVTAVFAEFIPTAKNASNADFFARAGFSNAATEGAKSVFRLDLGKEVRNFSYNRIVIK